MTGLAKGIIITVVVLVAVVVVCIGAAVYWISRQSGPLLAKSKEAMEEGQRFGRGTDNEGCVANTIDRYKAEPGFSNAVVSQLFLRGCLPTSHSTAAFCDNVPGPTEFVKLAQWEIEQCRRTHLEQDSYCGQLFTPISQFCETRRSGAPVNANR